VTFDPVAVYVRAGTVTGMADDPSVPEVSFTVTRHGFDREQVKAHVRGKKRKKE
jgi:hypothetical protein